MRQQQKNLPPVIHQPVEAVVGVEPALPLAILRPAGVAVVEEHKNRILEMED
jgi:hypothetical protein